MKLLYTQESPTGLSAEDDAIYAKIKERRGGALLPLDRALLHSPKLAAGEFHSSCAHHLTYSVPRAGHGRSRGKSERENRNSY